MKKIFTLIILLLCLKNTKAQYVTIPDPNFLAWLQTNVPSAMNGNQMDTIVMGQIQYLDIDVSNLGISDLTGIQYFKQTVTLDCKKNSLTTIPPLPNYIYNINCDSNQISFIPNLPSNLQGLSCRHNLLTSLPSLPNTMYFLDCNYNLLTSLPTLPTAPGSVIYCGHNQLVNLPPLPYNIYELRCEYNQLTSLPIMQNIIFNALDCSYNQLTSLPAITALELRCNNNLITCFEYFETSTNILDISNNPFSCLPNYIFAMPSNILLYPLCNSGNSNGCPNSAGIVGYIYKDNNSNCLKDNGDGSLINIHLKIYDISNNLIGHTYSLQNGVYGFSQTSSTYKVVVDTSSLPFISPCTNPGIDSTVTVAILDTNINFGFTCKPGFDVSIKSILSIGTVFPGQMHVLNLNTGDLSHWYNLNCATGISGTISFSVNGPVTYIGPAFGALTPSVTGNVFTYNIADYGTINNTTDFNLIFQTDTTAQAGDNICINATITPISGDYNPNNNTYNYCYQVINSYDPNIKEVYPIDVQPGFNDWLTYTIHFQNTGNAPAYNIRLADTLDNMLDLETFQVINYSHYNNMSVNGNILNVRFPNIMLPDSTSNPSGSIGYIQYRIKPKATWAAPYKIKNTAYIYFDYNAPIVTNTTYNSILVPTSLNYLSNTLATLYPNPTNGTFTVELNTKEKQSLQVFDIRGQMVLSQTIENGKATIDANYLAAGIYNISIKGNDTVSNKKLVIVK